MTHPRIDLNAEPVWTPGANPGVTAFAAAGLGRGGRRVPGSPFARDVRGAKWSPAYRAHMYHTKVPPEAIEPYIDHYTSRGDTVLDPFCGSGMTGLAALRRGRRALLSDLSPFATFLAYNNCERFDAAALRAALDELRLLARLRLERLYRTKCPRCGGGAEIKYAIWSDVLRCPGCGQDYVLWDAALGPGGRVHDRYPCPSCGRTICKQLKDRTGSRLAAACLDCPNGCDVKEVPLALGPASTRASTDGLWYPTDEIPGGLDELSRVRRSGVRTVADLFTPRNLHALAFLWAETSKLEPHALRARALFAVTAIMVRSSRLIKYIPSRRMAPGPILGTMYLPSFSAEINVLELFERRIDMLCRAAEAAPDSAGRLCISTQSACDLSAVPDASIDYVFTDPPFGHNIMYSELNFLWESWLGWRTDTRQEAVVSRSQRKGVGEYGGLMAAAFAEIHRVLKPGRWMTLVFHNTQADVWAAIQRGVAEAGLRVEGIQTLDKSHETFKQVTADGAVGYDVVVNCRKPPAGRRARRVPRPRQVRLPFPADNEREALRLLRQLLCSAADGPCKERTARYLHARLTGELVKSGAAVTLGYKDVLRLLHDHFLSHGKHWTICPTNERTP